MSIVYFEYIDLITMQLHAYFSIHWAEASGNNKYLWIIVHNRASGCVYLMCHKLWIDLPIYSIIISLFVKWN